MSLRGSVCARRVEVTEEIDTLAAPDYASAFEVAIVGADARSAEQWVRATFEGAPRALRRFVVVGWKYGLGFRLGPSSSPAHVLGWKIVTNTPDSIILELRSALMTAHKVLRVESSRILTTTFVRYERRTARALWSLVAPVHHRTEPYLLGHAASHPTVDELPNIFDSAVIQTTGTPTH
jgi:hypothetical protein